MLPLSRNRLTTQRKVRYRMSSKTNSVVAVFKSHDRAEGAIRLLQKDGFNMKNLSIVGKEMTTEEHVVGYYTSCDRMTYWGTQGAVWGGFWGGLWAMLVGSAFFMVPGIGPLLVAGPLVMWIVGAVEGAVVMGSLSALGAGLYSIGIPKNSIVQYETEVKNGKLLLVAHGTPVEVERAKELLDQSQAESTTIHAEATVAGKKPTLTVEIEIEGRNIPFRLDRQHGQWQTAEEQNESEFPLVTVIDGKRCELYSDKTFAEVDK